MWKLPILPPSPPLPSESTEADDESVWMAAISKDWADELSDSRQGIYTLADGKPIDERR
jgi:hypothetical protein